MDDEEPCKRCGSDRPRRRESDKRR
ncbi:uncharacterized protein G2W53_043612 [Senna tora]|uniref:Uncharacterized protein n=1 Tax=Senna tora TaxID=362788 RepID=A0A834W3K3_9FABA|nr:uncharacterized protein G2W53_043612 [Senna tora]